MSNTDFTTVDKPRDREPIWIAIALLVVFVGPAVAGYWAGGTGALIYLAVLVACAIIISFSLAQSLIVGLARSAAFVITILLILILWVSGLPLLIAELLRPIGQGIQDEGGNFGASVNLFWLIVVAILSLYGGWCAVKMYFTEKVVVIILAAFALALASLPVLGVIMQEIARNPGS